MEIKGQHKLETLFSIMEKNEEEVLPLQNSTPIQPSQQQQQVVYAIPLPSQVSPALQENLPSATVVAVLSTNSLEFGPNPVRIICPFCGADVITSVKQTVS